MDKDPEIYPGWERHLKQIDQGARTKRRRKDENTCKALKARSSSWREERSEQWSRVRFFEKHDPRYSKWERAKWLVRTRHII